MSVIRKKPFIDKVVGSLTNGQKETLLEIVNTPGGNIAADLVNMPGKGIRAVNFTLEPTGNPKTGILIYNDIYCVLIAHHRFQDLLMFELNPAKQTYEKVNEYLDINELRRILSDLGNGDNVTVSEIDSGDAAKGQVITADGNHGAKWTDKIEYLVLVATGDTQSGDLDDEELAMAQQNNCVVRYGDDGKLYYKQSQNNYYIVFSAAPFVSNDSTYVEKITIDVEQQTWSYEAQAIAAGEGFDPEYDASLSDSSENAVQNKVINAALETKANVDGYYPTMTAGLADNLTPYSEDSGAEQDNPFISNGTGTNNNTEIVTVGDYALFKEKQGHTLAVNQLLNITATTNTVDGVTFTVNADKSITLSGTASADITFALTGSNVKLLNNHKYILGGGYNNDIYIDNDYTSSVVGKSPLVTCSCTTTVSVAQFRIRVKSGTAISGTIKIVPILVDITSWEQSVIDDLTANPDHFSWYYNGSLAYNVGGLENADGVKLVATGRNLFDEETELGYYDVTTGEFVSRNNGLCSKRGHDILVNPNTDYAIRVVYPDLETSAILFYDENGNYIGWVGKTTSNTLKFNTFKTPANCRYIRFYLNTNYGTIYKNDITISLYYTPEEGGEGYDKYYPYEEPYVVETGSETLRQAGNVKDYKTPDGTIHRLVGVVTINGNGINGQGTWSQSSADNSVFYLTTDNIYFPYNAFSSKAQGISNKYQYKGSTNGGYAEFLDSDMSFLLYGGSSIGNIREIAFRDNRYTTLESFKTAINSSPIIVYFLLQDESITTEQGTPFAENLPINDYGMLYWLDSSNNLVGIPQGAKIFYPVNYKGFLDDIYARTSGDAQELVIKSELSEYVKQVDLSEQITDASGLTYDIKKAYKIGNVVFLTLAMQNKTGSDISANATLFNLGDSLIPSGSSLALPVRKSGSVTTMTIATTGNVTCIDTLANNQSIYLMVSYAVA